MAQRIDRISEEVHKALSESIRSLKDPRVSGGLVSVTRCEVTRDLRYANAYISVLGSDEQKKEVMRGLKSASGFLRRELGRALQLRYTPELQFVADDSIQHGAHILEVLRDPGKVKPVNPDNDAVLPEEE